MRWPRSPSPPGCPPFLWKSFLSLGLFAALCNLTQGEAYRIQLSSYVEAVKQTEIFFTLVMGYFLFKETKRIGEIAVGAVTILAGVIILILYVK